MEAFPLAKAAAGFLSLLLLLLGARSALELVGYKADGRFLALIIRAVLDTLDLGLDAGFTWYLNEQFLRYFNCLADAAMKEVVFVIAHRVCRKGDDPQIKLVVVPEFLRYQGMVIAAETRGHRGRYLKTARILVSYLISYSVQGPSVSLESKQVLTSP
jgi:hypothetical protein